MFQARAFPGFQKYLRERSRGALELFRFFSRLLTWGGLIAFEGTALSDWPSVGPSGLIRDWGRIMVALLTVRSED